MFITGSLSYLAQELNTHIDLQKTVI